MRHFWCIAILLLIAAPVAAQDMPLSEVLMPGETWRVVAEDCKAVHGLAADRDGNVYVADSENKHLTRISTDGQVKGVTMNEPGLYGLALGPDDRLYATQPGKRRIVAREADGKLAVVATDVAAYDLAVSRDGTIYCTVTDENAVFLVSPGGKKEPAASGLTAPAGLTLWPDQGTLVAGQANGSRLWAYRIAKDSSLTDKEDYYPLRGRPDHSPSGLAALTVDGKGRLYAATGVGVQVFDPTGRLSGVILKPEDAPLTALTFGGAKRDTLYVACGSKIYARKTLAKGVLPDKTER
jgi:sugar lactone lactonase YvrE